MAGMSLGPGWAVMAAFASSLRDAGSKMYHRLYCVQTHISLLGLERLGRERTLIPSNHCARLHNNNKNVATLTHFLTLTPSFEVSGAFLSKIFFKFEVVDPEADGALETFFVGLGISVANKYGTSIDVERAKGTVNRKRGKEQGLIITNQKRVQKLQSVLAHETLFITKPAQTHHYRNRTIFHSPLKNSNHNFHNFNLPARLLTHVPKSLT